MSATKKQIQSLNICFDHKGLFTCPCCKTQSSQYPDIENKGEDKTQIFCNYGCGYIFLEDHQQTEVRSNWWEAYL
jgi:uncharacterized protein YutD